VLDSLVSAGVAQERDGWIVAAGKAGAAG
jgi:hypothetical protein